VVRNTGWLFLLLSIYGARLRGTTHFLGSRRWLPWLLGALALGIAIIFVTPILSTITNIPQLLVKALVNSVWVASSLAGVLLLENIYRNSTESERWWIKYLCLGVGFLFVYDFFMYAEALILQQLDPLLWQSRGFVVALTAPLVAIAASRSRSTRSRIQLSRHVVFHTFTLLAAGIYLIFIAIVGYFVSYFGGTWSGVLQITFLSASVLIFLVMIFSSRLRDHSRVWLSKNFFSYKYDYRREWLDFNDTLAEGGDNTPRDIIRAMAKLGHSRAGLLWTRLENGGYRLKEEWQVDAPMLVDDFTAFTGWLQRTGWIVDVREWHESPHLYDGIDMPATLAEAPGIWMVIPLMFGKRLEGILLLRRSGQYTRLNWEDRDLLKVAAREAAGRLAQYYTSGALVELRQFEAHSRLSAYVIHDLKNILTQQSLIVSNASRHRGNLAFFDQVIDTVSNSVERMTRLMEQMQSGTRGNDSQYIELGELLSEVVASRSKSPPRPVLQPPAAAHWVHADREQLATVFGHIIQNAREATTKHGRVDVRLLQEGKRAVVEIEDDGVGMSHDFVKQRLFKPFDSTKGLTGMGIGAFESREFARSLGGDILVSSKEGTGSCFRIVLPSVQPEINEETVGDKLASG